MQILDTVLVGLVIFFGVSLFVVALLDGVIFYYKKRPGRGYVQMAKPGIPRWLIGFFSNLEIISFLGFIAVCLVLAWQFGL